MTDWGLDCSNTDAGDPWCVITDCRSGAILVHMARIDRKYAVVFPLQQRSLWVSSMTTAIETAISEIEARPVSVGHGRSL